MTALRSPEETSMEATRVPKPQLRAHGFQIEPNSKAATPARCTYDVKVQRKQAAGNPSQQQAPLGEPKRPSLRFRVRQQGIESELSVVAA